MKLTSCGHAFWILESTAGRILFDPVFADPFEQGTVTACPSRTFLKEQLPEYDLVYISHRHLDHFHIPTLQLLDKTKLILIPNDVLTIASMKKMGFTNIHIMEAFKPIRVQKENTSLTLYPTPSVSEDFLEYGLLIVESSPHGTHTLFNQVDTPLSDDCIANILSIAPQIDVHFAMFASQDFGWFHGVSGSLAETYTQNLYAVHRIKAKFVVPAAAGFRFVDRYQFLNQLLFPISQSRFIHDVQATLPTTQCHAINPGDILHIEESITVSAQASSFVAMKENDLYLIQYDPTTPIPALTDHNIANFPLHHLHGFATAVIEQGFVAYLQAGIAQKEEKVSVYTDHNAVYQLSVVFPDQTKNWTFSFSQDGFSLEKGESIHSPDALWKLTASALLELCEGKKSCWAIRPDSRKWSQLFRPQQTPMGLRTFEVELPELLTHFILNLRIRSRGEEQALLEYYGLC